NATQKFTLIVWGILPPETLLLLDKKAINEIPQTTDKGELTIVTRVKDTTPPKIHFRVFDDDNKMVVNVDSDDPRLQGKKAAIDAVVKRLDDGRLWVPHSLTPAERSEITEMVKNLDLPVIP